MATQFFEKKMKQAQDETEKLINEYARALDASPDASSIKTMVKAGAPAGSIADRAVTTHRALFSKVMAGARPKLLKQTRRVQIIEQFCVALWGRHLGDAPYRALQDKIKQGRPPAKAKK
jgi:hypothetical protein